MTAGDQHLLVEFDFNIESQLNATLFAPHTVAIDRVAGTLDVDFPEFVPSHTIVGPKGNTRQDCLCGCGHRFEYDASEVAVTQ